MKIRRKLGLFLFCVFVYTLSCMTVFAAQDDIVILYTNDIHTYIDNNIGEGNENGLTYSKVAALKKTYSNVLLVDAGDHVQGTAYGSMDQGETIMKLMNAAKYDIATFGNHEFDYGMLRCLTFPGLADFDYTSCNFYNADGDELKDTVLDMYIMKEVGGKKIAFIGITTPETMSATSPAYFQDENGKFIYDILGGKDGSQLYNSVQNAIDEAIAEGADYIIALGHLGSDKSSEPWTSMNVIENTSGLDAFIDGHSHTTMVMELVTDKSGKSVVLTQTGSYLDSIGCMTISADGTISTQLLTGDDLTTIEADSAVQEIEDAWVTEIDKKLGEVIGYSQVTFDNYDADGNRLVRKQSTNSGQFAADALYYLFEEMDMDVDIAVMNGGGVRNKSFSGELSYLSCKEIHTFGNVACLQTITGQQLLDALEWGVSDSNADGTMEAGKFLHVSGARYTIDLTIPSTVQVDENNIWTGGPTGEYRVKNVEIYNNETGKYEALDLSAKYNIAGYNYNLRDLGDGYAMFDGAVNVLDYVAEDYMVLANYIQSFEVDSTTGLPTITSDSKYSDLYGNGNISFIGATFKFSADETDAENEESTVTDDDSAYVVKTGDCLWAIARKFYGNGSKWKLIYEANKDIIANPRVIKVDQSLIIPAN